MMFWKKMSQHLNIWLYGHNKEKQTYYNLNNYVEVDQVLAKSSSFMELLASDPKTSRQPMPPRSEPGEFLMIWPYIERNRATYDHVLKVIKLAIIIPHKHRLFPDFAAVKVVPSINDGIVWPVDRIVSVTVLKNKYESIDDLSIDLFKRKIEMPPLQGSFQEIPEDQPLEGIFCKWYWDHSGEIPQNKTIQGSI